MFLIDIKKICNKKPSNFHSLNLIQRGLILNNLKKKKFIHEKKNFYFMKFFFCFLKNNLKEMHNIFLKRDYICLITHLQKQMYLNKIYNYLFKINFLKSNVMVSVTDTKGRILVKNSSGLMHFKNKQKTKTLAISAVFRKIKFKIRKLLNFKFSAHIKGKTRKKALLNKLKNFLELKAISNFNLIPFNGCRQKKKKRKKKKKLLYII